MYKCNAFKCANEISLKYPREVYVARNLEAGLSSVGCATRSWVECAGNHMDRRIFETLLGILDCEMGCERSVLVIIRFFRDQNFLAGMI